MSFSEYFIMFARVRVIALIRRDIKEIKLAQFVDISSIDNLAAVHDYC